MRRKCTGVVPLGHDAVAISNRKQKGEPSGSPFCFPVIVYCFRSSMLPLTLLARRSRPPFPILPEA